MDWFLYDNGLQHERVNIRSEIWRWSLNENLLTAKNHVFLSILSSEVLNQIIEVMATGLKTTTT